MGIVVFLKLNSHCNSYIKTGFIYSALREKIFAIINGVNQQAKLEQDSDLQLNGQDCVS